MTAVDEMRQPDHSASGAVRGGTRQRNVDRVVAALRADGPTSQANLARRLQLSPATISQLVRSLREEGIAEVQPRNRWESIVTLVSNDGALVAVQVSVGRLAAVLLDFGQGRRLDAVELLDAHQPGGSPEKVIDMVRDLTGRAGLSVGDLMGVAVGMQGPINTFTGRPASWARLQLPSWRDVVPADVLAAGLGVPVIVENDANLAALAEWTWGAGRGSKDFLYIMCSAGIGGGLVIDGKIYRGGDGLAGEIGHMVLDQNGPVCFCGSRGCLTTFASERAILLALESSGGPARSLREVIASAHHGDPACQAVLWEAGRHLGRALANTAKVVAPNVIAIGGLLAEADPYVFDSLGASVEVNSLRAVSPDIRVEPAQIRDDNTLLGGVAAILAATGQGLTVLPDWITAQTTASNVA